MRAVLALLVVMLAGCASEPPARDHGERPTIVSLNPCADAILTEIAEPAQLLAISHFSHSPRATSMSLQRARQFAMTGGTAEEVIALGPDIVVADTFLPPATKAALERSGISVVQIGMVSSLADSDAQIRTLAQASGHAARGEAMIDDIRQSWDRARWDGLPVSTLLWQEGGIVPGENSLAAAMLEHTGFSLLSAARGLGQGAYLPLEQVLADPPELLLAEGRSRMQQHTVLDNIPHRTFDSGLLYCGGPTIIRAMERLAAIRAEVG